MTELCRCHGISDATFYTWRSKYGGLEVSENRGPSVASSACYYTRRCFLLLCCSEILQVSPRTTTRTGILFFRLSSDWRSRGATGCSLRVIDYLTVKMSAAGHKLATIHVSLNLTAVILYIIDGWLRRRSHALGTALWTPAVALEVVALVILGTSTSSTYLSASVGVSSDGICSTNPIRPPSRRGEKTSRLPISVASKSAFSTTPILCSNVILPPSQRCPLHDGRKHTIDERNYDRRCYAHHSPLLLSVFEGVAAGVA